MKILGTLSYQFVSL